MQLVNDKLNNHRTMQILKASNLEVDSLNGPADVAFLKHQGVAKNKKRRLEVVKNISKLPQQSVNGSEDSSFKKLQGIGMKFNKKDCTSGYLYQFNQNIKAGTRVFMFCHGIPNMIVAHGIVVELMSYQRVEKPVDHVKVYVEKVFQPSVKSCYSLLIMLRLLVKLSTNTSIGRCLM